RPRTARLRSGRRGAPGPPPPVPHRLTRRFVMIRGMSILLFLLIAVSCGAAEHRPYTRNVAIVVYENAEPLDWTGPFEVYNDAGNFGSANGEPAFHVYVVSKTKDPLNAQGLTVVPNYSIADAPKPDIVVFPGGPSSKI